MGAEIMAVDKRSGAAQRGDAILKRVGRNARGVEVGVFRGALSRYLLRKGVDRLFMVDNWLPADEQPKHYKETRDYCAGLAPDEAAANEALARQVAAASGGRAVVLKMSSVDAARQINDGSMDFVFLDGDHSYEGLKADIAAWLPKVRKGGWIGGHDIDNPEPPFDFTGVRKAVDEAFPGGVDADENFTWFVRTE